MKRITQESGARIHLEEIEEGKTCTISGSDESVKKAKTMIDECLNVLKVWALKSLKSFALTFSHIQQICSRRL